MRIVGGIYRSRKIQMVGVSTTRETTDMVRESVFNLLSMVRIEGKGLDLFSGSGAMGLEAISRGLDYCYFNDMGKEAYKITKENIKALGLENKTTVHNNDYLKELNILNDNFDFIFLDPPYKLDCINNILEFLNEKLLKIGGYIVVEIEKDYQIKEFSNLIVYKDRTYGIRRIVILKKC